MSNQPLSIYYSDDQLKTVMIFDRAGEFRVVCLESYFGKEYEYYFKTEQEAENFAEEWVL